ncbi:hypothetical protein LINPERHAP2_LOCUS29678 [Linum perenne]
MGYAEPNYCGSEKATDPNFPGYVDTALNQVINDLISENVYAAGIVIPPGPNVIGSAYAIAACSLNTGDECRGCLDGLLVLVRACRFVTTGVAYDGTRCNLGFRLETD